MGITCNHGPCIGVKIVYKTIKQANIVRAKFQLKEGFSLYYYWCFECAGLHLTKSPCIEVENDFDLPKWLASYKRIPYKKKDILAQIEIHRNIYNYFANIISRRKYKPCNTKIPVPVAKLDNRFYLWKAICSNKKLPSNTKNKLSNRKLKVKRNKETCKFVSEFASKLKNIYNLVGQET